MAPTEVSPVTEQNWEGHSWSFELEAPSSKCRFLHRALAGGHVFAPSGTWLVCFGRPAVSVPGLGLNAIQSLYG